MACRRICCVVLVALVSLALAACSGNRPVRLRYQAEKMLFDVERQLQNARYQPDQMDDQQRLEMAQAFGRVAEFSLEALQQVNVTEYPVVRADLERIAYRSSNRLSQYYYYLQQYDTCITVLKRLLGSTSQAPAELVTTYINLGQALQASGAWDSALATYEAALESLYPPLDTSGQILLDLFNLPAHIFQVTTLTGNSTEARLRFREAEEYYRTLLREHPDTWLASACRTNLARIYEEVHRWEDVVAQLSAVKDSTGHQDVRIRLKIADVYAMGLGRYDQALQLYEEILSDLSGPDTIFRPTVMYEMALVKMEKKEYAAARATLNDLKDEYPGFFASSPTAQLAVARSFELEGNWNRAATEYSYLIEHYRGSEEAMATYLHLASEFARQGRHQEADRWYRNAEQYYDDIIDRESNSLLQARALLHKADMFQRQEHWQASTEMLLELFSKFPKTRPGRMALLKAAAIFSKKLNQATVADSLLEVLRETVPIGSNGQWES